MVTIEDQPWFVAREVEAVLGFKPEDISKRGRRWFAAGEYRTITRSSLANTEGSLFGQYGGKMALISESALYKIILRSERTRPEVEKFQDWVTREVLPSIRKTGAYVEGQPSLVENPGMDPPGRPLLHVRGPG